MLSMKSRFVYRTISSIEWTWKYPTVSLVCILTGKLFHISVDWSCLCIILSLNKTLLWNRLPSHTTYSMVCDTIPRSHTFMGHALIVLFSIGIVSYYHCYLFHSCVLVNYYVLFPINICGPFLSYISHTLLSNHYEFQYYCSVNSQNTVTENEIIGSTFPNHSLLEMMIMADYACEISCQYNPDTTNDYQL